MKINIYPISSSLHDQNYIEETTQDLINKIAKELNHQICLTSIDKLYDGDLSLILVQSGGSENVFLKHYHEFKPPFYLLTFATNNSLAASLEILSYIKNHHEEGEILHGSIDYLSKRISELLSLKETNFGIIGKPSDWLIASNVDYEMVKKIYHINLKDISLSEVVSNYNLVDGKDLPHCFLNKFNFDELTKSERVYLSLKQIAFKHNLSGLSIRCFDLLTSLKTTSCLALAKLNQEGIMSSCEGDIPTLISMEVVKRVTSSSSFQANPCQIDNENKRMVFAHCTLPLDMVTSFKLDTHYESKIGVAIKGELEENKEITIFKISNNLKDYFVSRGRIIRNLNEKNLCRTQIEIEIDNPEYFLKHPFGNHHLIIYGNHVEALRNYMERITKDE